jgi:D-alanyl-D-alanine carboxypeptidase
MEVGVITPTFRNHMTTRIRVPRAVISIAILGVLAACSSRAPAVTASASSALPAGAVDSRVILLDSIVRTHREMDPGIPGAQVAVWHDGRLILSRGYGSADLEHGRPLKTNHIFRLASVTKQFTAAAIVRLAEQGRLTLDDPLSRWVPEYPTGEHIVTIRHLLTNTSGIPNFAHVDPNWLANAATPLPPLESLARMSEYPLLFAPGERFDYSNTGYFLLGIIIERASGRSYAEEVRDLTAAHGLTSLDYCPDHPAPGHSHGYRSTEEGNRPALPFHMTRAFSAGALCGTAEDLVRWNRALNRGEVVSAASVAEMVTPPAVRTGRTAYGYGLVVGSLAGQRRVMHGGGIRGFSAQVAYYPEHDLGIAVLFNTDDSPPALLEGLLARAVLGLELPATKNLPTAAEERELLVGTYTLAGTHLRVFERDGMLWGGITGQSPARLLHQGDHEFRAAFDPNVRFVFHVEAGRSVGFTLHQGGAEISGVRVDCSGHHGAC